MAGRLKTVLLPVQFQKDPVATKEENIQTQCHGFPMQNLEILHATSNCQWLFILITTAIQWLTANSTGGQPASGG